MATLFQSLKTCPQRLYAWLAAGFWTARGRKALRRGEIGRGIKALERAVSRRPEAFKPLLLLAGGYLLAEETRCAHRVLARARETDPVRFARLASGLLAREGVDPDTLARVLVSTMPRPRPGSRIPTLSVAHPSPRDSRSAGPAHHPYGDCADLAEYARFRAMPRITRDEIDTLDWDSFLEDLLDD